MIRIQDVNKRYADVQAVKNVTLNIREGEVFGLVGTNGAGKSTLLRMICGVICPDSGTIQVDGKPVYESEEIKSRMFYISDDAYFFPNSTPKEMAQYYSFVYPEFDKTRFKRMMEQFGLDEKRRIHTFSKGMKKQLSVILGLSACTKYLFCDETFDGLDPVMRQAVKSLFASEICSREFTPVIASHNLRELEDICEHVGLLHEGGILLSKDLEDMKFHIHKVQCVVPDEGKEEQLLKELEVLQYQRQGSLLMITARGTRTEIMSRVEAAEPIFCEIIPLSLEEIFISETEVAGYEIKNIIL
ncbi:MAG: ABC transporter ATP-binding protein [Eubacteriales bacterium]|nr:ABC transporter ATP-binding protein [Eubacteriales bacterium]